MFGDPSGNGWPARGPHGRWMARDSEGRERDVADRAQDSGGGAVAADVVG